MTGLELLWTTRRTYSDREIFQQGTVLHPLCILEESNNIVNQVIQASPRLYVFHIISVALLTSHNHSGIGWGLSMYICCHCSVGSSVIIVSPNSKKKEWWVTSKKIIDISIQMLIHVCWGEGVKLGGKQDFTTTQSHYGPNRAFLWSACRRDNCQASGETI